MPWYEYVNHDDERKIANIQVTNRAPLNRAFASTVEKPSYAAAIRAAEQHMHWYIGIGFTVHIHIKPNPEEPNS